ncbi:MAG: hypothetical protein M1358_14355, partial [Chloroflexi bacterium]|nr:hypothetical protein [Chloroflexota bacterium]
MAMDDVRRKGTHFLSQAAPPDQRIAVPPAQYLCLEPYGDKLVYFLGFYTPFELFLIKWLPEMAGTV